MTEFKSFNLFLNRMAKKKTTQGIGYINSRTEFDNLVTKVASIITEEFNRTSDNATAINNVKRSIDNLVGRTRQSFTKTDVYQVSYLMFYSILKDTAEAQSRTFKETQVNTLVAKLMTEGEYGNPSVVRRQTTSAKLTELKSRLFPSLVGGIFAFANYVYYSLSGAQQRDLNSAAQRMAVRGSRSTTTTRVSNRTRRTTTPRSTTPRSTTPRATTPAAAPSQVTESSRQVTAYQVPDLTSSSQLAVGVRESIKRFSETSDKKVKLELMAGAWRYRALASLILNESERLTISDLKNFTNGVITRIGDVYNPATEAAKYKEALEYLKYVVFLLTSGKMRSAKILMGSNIFIGETRATLSRKIFALGIGSNSVTVFGNFARYIGGDNRVYTAITRLLNRGPEVTMSMFASYLKGTPSAPSATSTRTTPTRTTPSTTRQVRDDNPRSTTPPESSVTPTLIREIPFTGTLGVEIEYYGVPKNILEDKLIAGGIKARESGYTHATTPYWKLTTDSTSLGKHSGEMVSPILKGKAGLVEMRKCINICQEAGMLVNKSGGMHVHFGMQGVSVQSIVNIITNYYHLQPIIDKMLHRWRRSSGWASNFTRGQIDALQRATTMNDVFNAISGSNSSSWTREDARHGGRYHAINVFCYLAYGTIEFRQYTSVLESDTALMWVYFLHFLIEVSKKKQLTRYDWTNVENFLPKKVATFWANRIYELGDGTDSVVTDFRSRETR